MRPYVVFSFDIVFSTIIGVAKHISRTLIWSQQKGLQDFLNINRNIYRNVDNFKGFHLVYTDYKALKEIFVISP